ncbi:MAG: TIGR02281 family clan AA aspartic protease [Robiginitomaculum sp.]|nr:MAG: TIGR02281 family clan AA aspartic protease [Robiginitomaculum sp.]
MSNNLIRDAILASLIFSGGFYAFLHRDKIYEYAGISPQDIVNVREANKASSNPVAHAPTASPIHVGDHSTTISKAADGQYWTMAHVNNSEIRFLIDTGASVVVLTPDDAQKAGLRPDSLEYDVPVNTASGQIFAASVELASVSVGNVLIYNVRAVVIPKGLTHSLLGMSYLGELQKLEVTSEELTLRQ